jgi:hypothetical protein
MKWNGSHLGEINTKQILNEYYFKNVRHWKLLFDNKIYYCMVEVFKDNNRILIDELKPIFGLRKLGTHKLKFNNETYIIIKLPTIDVSTFKLVLHPTYLNNVESDKMDDIFRKLVQKVYAFRYLMGIKRNGEADVIIMAENNNIYPVSFLEPTIATDDSRISNSVHENWFGRDNETICEAIKQMTNFDGREETLHIKVEEYRKKIEAVINRIDKNLIWNVNFIVQKLMTQYLEIFT